MSQSKTISFAREQYARLTADERIEWQVAQRRYREAIKSNERIEQHLKMLSKITIELALGYVARNYYEAWKARARGEDYQEIDGQRAVEKASEWLRKECPDLFGYSFRRIPPKPEIGKRHTRTSQGYRDWLNSDPTWREAMAKAEQDYERAERFCRENGGLICEWRVRDQLGNQRFQEWIERGMPFIIVDGDKYFDPASVNAWIKANTRSQKRLL